MSFSIIHWNSEKSTIGNIDLAMVLYSSHILFTYFGLTRRLHLEQWLAAIIQEQRSLYHEYWSTNSCLILSMLKNLASLKYRHARMYRLTFAWTAHVEWTISQAVQDFFRMIGIEIDIEVPDSSQYGDQQIDFNAVLEMAKGLDGEVRYICYTTSLYY